LNFYLNKIKSEGLKRKKKGKKKEKKRERERERYIFILRLEIIDSRFFEESIQSVLSKIW